MTKALVVDDSRAIRMLLTNILRQLGYEVQQAANGREALEVIEAGNDRVRLVLADWNMPEMNGLELLKRLRQDHAVSSMAVVMVSTEKEINRITEALDAGENQYVMN